jgi:hypothetical protein
MEFMRAGCRTYLKEAVNGQGANKTRTYKFRAESDCSFKKSKTINTEQTPVQ